MSGAGSDPAQRSHFSIGKFIRTSKFIYGKDCPPPFFSFKTINKKLTYDCTRFPVKNILCYFYGNLPLQTLTCEVPSSLTPNAEYPAKRP